MSSTPNFYAVPHHSTRHGVVFAGAISRPQGEMRLKRRRVHPSDAVDMIEGTQRPRRHPDTLMVGAVRSKTHLCDSPGRTAEQVPCCNKKDTEHAHTRTCVSATVLKQDGNSHNFLLNYTPFPVVALVADVGAQSPWCHWQE